MNFRKECLKLLFNVFFKSSESDLTRNFVCVRDSDDWLNLFGKIFRKLFLSTWMGSRYFIFFIVILNSRVGMLNSVLTSACWELNRKQF